MVCSGKWPNDGAITPQSGANTHPSEVMKTANEKLEKFANSSFHKLSKVSTDTSQLNIPTMQYFHLSALQILFCIDFPFEVVTIYENAFVFQKPVNSRAIIN